MTHLCLAAAVTLALAAPADAATAGFSGAFWNMGTSSIDAALATVADRPADATFRSTAIDYPNGAALDTFDTDTLGAFLGADAGSLSGFGATTLDGSVFRFAGNLLLGAGPHTFTVGSDDGFALSIAGTEVARANDRGFGLTSTTLDLADGPFAFALVYYENGGKTGVEFRVDGQIVDAALGAPAAVPLPAALPLLAAALGGIGLAARRRRGA